MKIRYIISFLLLALSSQSQITDLSKLSEGIFYSQDEIRDANNNIKGYFLLFESDHVGKETYDLEYVVLDENLTKVTSGMIREMKYESALMTARKIKVRAILYKKKLLLEFVDQFQSVEAFQRYRILDLTTNKLSDLFVYNKDKMILNPPLSRKAKDIYNFMSQDIKFYDGVGLVVKSEVIDRKEGRTKKYIAHYDDNFSEVWRYIYQDTELEKNKVVNAEYLKSDSDIVILYSHHTKPNFLYLNDFTFFFIDAKTGQKINTFEFPDVDLYTYNIVDVKIKDDTFQLLGNYGKKTKFGVPDDTQNFGLFKFTFNKSDGKLIDTKLNQWPQISGKIPISKTGYIKDEGYIFIHNMLVLNDDSIIVVAEAFTPFPITTNNMYFMKISKEFAVTDIHEVYKFRNKFPRTEAESKKMKEYGLFDFLDYQNLGNDEYLFFFNDNEKNSRNRKKTTLYGVVSYSEGKFYHQTINLKTEVSSIYALNAKKGYLLLIEDFDAPGASTEFRLEKINH